MTNTAIKILFFLLLYLLTYEAKSQLIADAGHDTIFCATISNPWAKPETTTIYGLTIIDSAGCEAASNCNVFVYPVNIDNHYLIDRYIKINPNPIYSIAYIFTENSDFNDLKFEILNLNGILVREIKINGQVTPFSVTGLKSGLFLYRLISDDKETDAGKILIQPFYIH